MDRLMQILVKHLDELGCIIMVGWKLLISYFKVETRWCFLEEVFHLPANLGDSANVNCFLKALFLNSLGEYR